MCVLVGYKNYNLLELTQTAKPQELLNIKSILRKWCNAQNFQNYWLKLIFIMKFKLSFLVSAVYL